MMLVVGAGMQLVLPSTTKLPQQSELAPRRVHEPAQMAPQEYPAVLANPIFVPDRKPDASAVPVSGGMNGFSVLGIAVAGNKATAVVRGPGGIQRLKTGDAMNGWKLVTVELDQLTFERNKERRVLMIAKGAPPEIALERAKAGPGNKTTIGQATKSDDDSDDDDDN
ncbi:MAG TPA: hypothetical protein VII49_07950 [Rhizomicrobium sp.]